MTHALTRQWEHLHKQWLRTLYFGVVLLGAAVTLAIVVYAAVLLWNGIYIGAAWNVHSGVIYSVDDRSPAAQAGLHVGDRIRRINGRPLSTPISPPQNASTPAYITFTVERSGQELTIPVSLTAPPLWVRVRRWIPLLVALAFWGISLGVWAFHPNHNITRLFFFTSQVTAALLAVGTLTTLYVPHVAWSCPVFGLLLLILPPMTLHFFALFPPEIPTPLRRRLLLSVYGTALLLGGITLLGYWGKLPPSWPYKMFNRIYVIVVFILTLFVVFRHWRDASLRTLRYRRLVIMNMGISIAPLLFLSLIPDFIQGAPLVDYTWTFLFLPVIPFTYAHAIRTGELGTVDWVLSRTLAHLILSGIFLIIYLFLFLWLDTLVPSLKQTSPLLVAGLAVLVAALFAPTRRYLLYMADHFLYGGWYDYRTTLQELSERLKDVLQVEDLANLLVNRLGDVLRLRGVAFYLREGDRLRPIRAIGALARSAPPSLSLQSHVAQGLVRMGKPITSAHLRQSLTDIPLTPVERTWLDAPDVALWLPLIHGGQLKGLLLLGDRIGGDPLEREDLRLLDILAAHAATAVDNIQLVESLRARVEEIKQLYAQLAQAREDERKHLARELHDVVLQDVINAHVVLDQVLATSQDKAPEQLARVHKQTLRSIRALRRLCSELRPPALDITDLRSALEGLIEDVHQESDLEISATFPEGGYQALEGIPYLVSITLYRALQEALANVRRHARARRVDITVEKQDGWITLDVVDDGQGFEVPPRLGLFVRERHYGLAGLAERVQSVGGTLRVESTPGRGTRVRVRVPLDVE